MRDFFRELLKREVEIMTCTDIDVRHALDTQIRNWIAARGLEWAKRPVNNNIKPLMEKVVDDFIAKGCNSEVVRQTMQRVSRKMVALGFLGDMADPAGSVYPLEKKGFCYYSGTCQ